MKLKALPPQSSLVDVTVPTIFEPMNVGNAPNGLLKRTKLIFAATRRDSAANTNLVRLSNSFPTHPTFISLGFVCDVRDRR
jgi:hypothetical protein